MYSNKIYEILRNPVNAGGLQGADATGKYENADTNEVYKIYIKFDENREYVEEARFKTMGNPIAIVASSALTEIVKGKTVEELLTLSNQDIISEIGDVPEDKIYCTLDVICCLQNAVKTYLKKLEKENNQ